MGLWGRIAFLSSSMEALMETQDTDPGHDQSFSSLASVCLLTECCNLREGRVPVPVSATISARSY